MTELPELNKGQAAAALTPAARLVHLRALTSFANTGRALRRDEIVRLARTHGADADDVLAELAERDVIAFDGRGEIRAAYPFSPTPTAIRVTWAGGPTAYAMCAIDALGMSAMLDRPVTITASEPGTGHMVTVEVDGDHAEWQPNTAVVFAGATDDECCPSVDRTCGHINFFTSDEIARAWADQHAEITGTVLGRSQALALGAAEFGTLMDPLRA
ncbi:MAG TPA: alkylmercury lyase family protein [Jiangellaceae bacterium]|nr:alkylmercury lyase family protein [Jiangellaceae bacterium]